MIAQGVANKLPMAEKAIPEVLTRQHAQKLVTEVLDTMNPDANPGYPLDKEFSKNADWLRQPHVVDYIAEIAVERLLAISELNDDDLARYVADPISFLQAGLCDPYTASNKGEPHSKRKIDLGKFRNVWCSGVVDQIALKCLTYDYSTDLKQHYMSGSFIAAGHGATREHDEATGNAFDVLFETFANVYKSDVANWDGRFSWVATLMLIEVLRLKLKPPLWWLRALKFSLLTGVNCTFQIGTGALFLKRRFGLMPSGIFLTAIGNSVGRGAAAQAAGSLMYLCMGDDTVEASNLTKSELISNYAKLGLTLREVDSCDKDGFVFCSRIYKRRGGGWRSSLESWPKAVYKYVTKGKGDISEVSGLVHEMRHNGARAKRALAAAVRLKM